MGLKEAMTQIKQDTLFWTREVYESVARQKGNKGSAGPDSPAWTAFQPLVPISATMEQVEGTPEWSSNGAKVSPKGVQYCRDHFIKKKCPGNCGRSHNFPVLKNWLGL